MHPDPDSRDVAFYLSAWRDERISDEEARAIIKHMPPALASRLKRTAFLRLKRGDPRPAFLNALPSCASCCSVADEGEFADYAHFQDMDRRLSEAAEAAVLTERAAPQWYPPPTPLLGGQHFYRCNTCGAVWAMLLPERAQRGSWQRVG